MKAGTYEINVAHAYAHFAINPMGGLSTMRGRMDVQKGAIRIGDAPSNSRIEVEANKPVDGSES